MNWEKLGLIFQPDSTHPKLISHAANPLAVHMNDDIFRIFYSGRDTQNRSSVGAVDIDIITREIITSHNEPFFVHGPEGSFHADGISIGGTYQAGINTYMLFMGWQTPAGGHWRGDVGRFTVQADFTLTEDDPRPFMGSDEHDPISLSYPWVHQRADGVYDMWYGSTVDWHSPNGEMIHTIKHATSTDGENWDKDDQHVPYELGVAQAFSRPTVLIDDDNTKHMWFSYRDGAGTLYRIGYAVQKDGKDWQLCLDKSGIHPSATGWDSEMIEYPFVFGHKSDTYMLYNGNGFGRSGFGLARLEA